MGQLCLVSQKILEISSIFAVHQIPDERRRRRLPWLTDQNSACLPCN